MDNFSILKDMKINRVANDAVAGTSTVTSSAISMAGFDSVLFLVLIGDSTNGSVQLLTVLSNPTNSNSGGTAETGATAGKTDPDGTSLDNGMYAVEVHRPSQDYVYCTFARGTQNCVVDGIIAIQFNARSVPQSLVSAMIASAVAGPNR